jgi:ubiquinone/menaquinone biosynthesis C-methylase UbiE
MSRRTIPGALLSLAARVWPDPTVARTRRLKATPGTPEYARAYAREQYESRVGMKTALGDHLPSFKDKVVLEIGCGHGGVSCFWASLGAKRVVGIDLGEDNFVHGRELARELGLPVELVRMDATRMTFADASFDVVIADNSFEHFSAPADVMREAHRVLRPGGVLVVPTFSSILSKWGLHLKLGLKIPWANLVFEEETIVEALRRQAERRPQILDWYPGLKNPEARRVRDVRQFGDLNDVTHRTFLEMARDTGFEVKTFIVHGTRLGRVLSFAAPALKTTRVMDVLSTAASAVLRKVGSQTEIEGLAPDARSP